ncbi:MAG: MarC family protein [Candidatus Caldarchaeum sp.]
MEAEVFLELLKAIVSLFIIVDPVGVLPFVVSLTGGLSTHERRRLVDRSVVAGTFLLLVFSIGGQGLLWVLGIELPSFTVAGGLLLLILALRILVQGGEGWGTQGKTSGVFPIAFPLLAGPGAITTVIFSINSLGILFSVITVLIVMGLTWLILRSIEPVLRAIGESGADAVARIMSVFVAAIGVQYIVSGLAEMSSLF